MYSFEDRMQAVELYIQYNKNAAVLCELGYPKERNALRKWYDEYLQSKGDLKRTRIRANKSILKNKGQKLLKYYLTHGKSIAQTIKVR